VRCYRLYASKGTQLDAYMITFDDQLRLQVTNLATVQVGLYNRGENLLEGNLQRVELGPMSASGRFDLPCGANLRLRMDLEPIVLSADQSKQSLLAVCLKVTLTNAGSTCLSFDRFDVARLDLTTGFTARPIWTMQAAAVQWGQDFAFELPLEFSRQNFLGHLQDGEGGGIPLVYFWNKSQGIALMHIEPVPKEVYMPVTASNDRVSAALQLRQPVLLQPGESFSGPKTVISLHTGDFFAPLALYRELLAAQGLSAPEPVPACFEPSWCSWGYEFDVKPDELTGVLPVLGELGIRWLTLDDRWFDAYADWNPRKDTFPNGAEDMRHMNAEIHKAGSFSQIWWYPLCAEDGHGTWESHAYVVSQALKDHPDWVILNADGSVARNNRHLAMLCPALPAVQEYTAELARRFIYDWGFDGHKLDNIYTVPACHNPAHHHAYPEQSIEAMGTVYQLIFDITRQLRPDSVTQICPCGTPISLHLIPYTDQSVTADPTSSQQIRQRIKFYKALMGPKAAVSADHVELSDHGVDFASEIGTGGVPTTKFIWPDDQSALSRLKEVWSLTEERKAHWKRWLSIYNHERPSEGEYLNLYDLAFDVPEAHGIRKGDTLYYAFYTHALDEGFSGKLQLHGLEESKSYLVCDYANGREVSRIDGLQPFIHVHFTGALLLKVTEARFAG
jgi:alpha-galactosidase